MSSPEPIPGSPNLERLPGVNLWIEDASALRGQPQSEGRVEQVAGLNVWIDEPSKKATPPDERRTPPSKEGRQEA